MGENGYWIFLDAVHLDKVVAKYWDAFIGESLFVMFLTAGILYILPRDYRRKDSVQES
jgi:hypothetical protein